MANKRILTENSNKHFTKEEKKKREESENELKEIGLSFTKPPKIISGCKFGKETVIIGDTEKKKTLVTRKKNNPYTAKDGIEIPDNEYFKKYLLNDIDGNEIGCIYIAADLDIDD